MVYTGRGRKPACPWIISEGYLQLITRECRFASLLQLAERRGLDMRIALKLEKDEDMKTQLEVLDFLPPREKGGFPC